MRDPRRKRAGRGEFFFLFPRLEERVSSQLGPLKSWTVNRFSYGQPVLPRTVYGQPVLLGVVYSQPVLLGASLSLSSLRPQEVETSISSRKHRRAVRKPSPNLGSNESSGEPAREAWLAVRFAGKLRLASLGDARTTPWVGEGETLSGPGRAQDPQNEQKMPVECR